MRERARLLFAGFEAGFPLPHSVLLGRLPLHGVALLISENYLMLIFNISLKLNIIRKINQLLNKASEDTQMIPRISGWSGLPAWGSGPMYYTWADQGTTQKVPAKVFLD